MRQEDEVVSCYKISGTMILCCLLHAKDMESYHAFTRRVLTGEFRVRTYKVYL